MTESSGKLAALSVEHGGTITELNKIRMENRQADRRSAVWRFRPPRGIILIQVCKVLVLTVTLFGERLKTGRTHRHRFSSVASSVAAECRLQHGVAGVKLVSDEAEGTTTEGGKEKPWQVTLSWSEQYNPIPLPPLLVTMRSMAGDDCHTRHSAPTDQPDQHLSILQVRMFIITDFHFQSVDYHLIHKPIHPSTQGPIFETSIIRATTALCEIQSAYEDRCGSDPCGLRDMNPSVAGSLLFGWTAVARCSQYAVLKLFFKVLCCIHTREPERPGAFSCLVGYGIPVTLAPGWSTCPSIMALGPARLSTLLGGIPAQHHRPTVDGMGPGAWRSRERRK
ncbi:hypothetical protein M747DRAFT_324342 [Aspergillus niger ATCC 13496]|uniref:Uncharacterized protein n=1 Tax=Aspergillus niger ATCC 13496 TaxID=1353008 RepID=A0A370BSA9_ASPNG|nr:hypothetical protein M747DRAFT_324342 [Aspergillus niger ATCC 13496]